MNNEVNNYCQMSDNETSVIFHIGLHKTGSTFLQKELFSKIQNPRFNYINNNNTFRYFLNKTIYRDNLYFDEALKSNIIKKNKINLVSAENLSGNPEGISFNLKNILDNLYNLCEDSKIILFIRKQDDFAESNYVQSIRSGSNLSIRNMYKYVFKEDLPLRHYQIIYKDLFQYKKYIDYIYTKFHFENILLIPFEDLKYNYDVTIKKIFNFIGITPFHVINKTKNSRIGILRILILRFLNTFFTSHHNPYGIIKGIPFLYIRKNRIVFRFLQLSNLFHFLDKFNNVLCKIDPPYKDKTGTCKKILKICARDNKELDERYRLGLDKYGYY